jgi:hypothetical protein
MSKKLPILVLLSLALAGCEVGHLKLPMTLGPSDAAPASCLGDTAAHGDCKAPAAHSGTQDTN